MRRGDELISLTPLEFDLLTQLARETGGRWIQNANNVERLAAEIVTQNLSSYVLAYDVKVRELAAMLDLTPWMTDINKPFAAEDLAGALGALLEQRADVATAVSQRSAVLGAEARRNFDAARAWVRGTAATAKV